jgi:hypothetical protein
MNGPALATRNTKVRRLSGLADIQCAGLHQGLSCKLQVHQSDSNDLGDCCLSGPAAVSAFHGSTTMCHRPAS